MFQVSNLKKSESTSIIRISEKEFRIPATNTDAISYSRQL